MAFRSDELKGSTTSYPGDGCVRGGSKYEDWYYFTGFTIYIGIGSGRAAMAVPLAAQEVAETSWVARKCYSCAEC